MDEEIRDKRGLCKGLPYAALPTRPPRAVARIERKYGIIGYAIYCKLLSEVAGQNGYFTPWTDFDTDAAIEEWSEQFPSILADLIEWGIFSRDVFEQLQILTSEDLIAHYLQAKHKDISYISPTISDILRQSPTFSDFLRERGREGASDQESERPNDRDNQTTKQANNNQGTRGKGREIDKGEGRPRTANGNLALELFENVFGCVPSETEKAIRNACQVRDIDEIKSAIDYTATNAKDKRHAWPYMAKVLGLSENGGEV